MTLEQRGGQEGQAGHAKDPGCDGYLWGRVTASGKGALEGGGHWDSPPPFSFLSDHRGSHCSRGPWSHLTSLPHSHSRLLGKEESAPTAASNQVTKLRLSRTQTHKHTSQTSIDKDTKMTVSQLRAACTGYGDMLLLRGERHGCCTSKV